MEKIEDSRPEEPQEPKRREGPDEIMMIEFGLDELPDTVQGPRLTMNSEGAEADSQEEWL